MTTWALIILVVCDGENIVWSVLEDLGLPTELSYSTMLASAVVAQAFRLSHCISIPKGHLFIAQQITQNHVVRCCYTDYKSQEL